MTDVPRLHDTAHLNRLASTNLAAQTLGTLYTRRFRRDFVMVLLSFGA
jgi:hypothetical protein